MFTLICRVFILCIMVNRLKSRNVILINKYFSCVGVFQLVFCSSDMEAITRHIV